MIIRPITVEDAAAFSRLSTTIDGETKFMLYEPGERILSVEEQEQRIRKAIDTPNQMILVAEEEGQLVGFIGGIGGHVRRNRHSITIAAGILDAFTGRGLGTKLFTELERWAREIGAYRLDLMVMAHNERGVALYKKMGFEIEGRKRHGVCVDGVYHDELVMGKLLD